MGMTLSVSPITNIKRFAYIALIHVRSLASSLKRMRSIRGVSQQPTAI